MIKSPMKAGRQKFEFGTTAVLTTANNKLLQRKGEELTASTKDPLETEAERIAGEISAGSGFKGTKAGSSNSGLDSTQRFLANSGRPLEPGLQQEMEQRLGFDLSRVRIFADGEAADAAAAVQARAYTLGNNIVFGSGKFAPETAEGGRLLAHELVHVVQQRATSVLATQSTPVHLRTSFGTMQMDKDPAATGANEGRVLTVVIRAPDDKYTQNVTDYVRNTLDDPNIIEVDNIQEVFPYLEKIKQSKGPKLKRIRLIAHGSTIGGIKMKLPGKQNREFVNPAELEKMAQDKNLQTIAQGAMESDATVEFYGCYVGGEPTTEAAISTMFQSEFRSPDEALHTEEATFEWNSNTITSSAKVDELAKKDKKVQGKFEDWLLKRHQQLVSAGDIPDAGNKQEKIAVMRDLFDRSQGHIKQLIIEKKSGEKVRPSQKGAWASEWRRWNVN
jgi:Domain of unknown function (DUF4157)